MFYGYYVFSSLTFFLYEIHLNFLTLGPRGHATRPLVPPEEKEATQLAGGGSAGPWRPWHSAGCSGLSLVSCAQSLRGGQPGTLSASLLLAAEGPSLSAVKQPQKKARAKGKGIFTFAYQFWEAFH